MTTLELAEKIARAVLKAVDSSELCLLPHDEYFGKDTDLQAAIFQTLHEHGAWFCRIQTEDTPDGLLDVGSTPYEQQELFR